MSTGKKILVWGGILLGLVILGLVGTHFYYKWTAQRTRAALLAQGEKLTTGELLPPAPMNYRGTMLMANFAAVSDRSRKLAQQLVPGMKIVDPGQALVCSVQPAPLWNGKETNSWEDLHTALEQVAPTLQLLRDFLNPPPLQFVTDYSQGYTTRLPHLAQFKTMSQLFAAATLDQLHARQLPSALTNVHAMLAVAHCAREEGFLISHLVRIAVAHIGATTTWEILQTPGWTDAQLRELQERWQSLSFAPELEYSLKMERATALEMFDTWRANGTGPMHMMNGWGRGGPPPGPPQNLQQALDQLFGGTAVGTVDLAWQWFWSYPDETKAMRAQQVIIEGLRAVAFTNAAWPQVNQAMDGQLVRLGLEITSEDDHAGFLNWNVAGLTKFLSSGIDSLRKASKRAVITETLRELTITAIALHRYQLKHQHPAPDLAALVPEFLAKPPRDWMGNAPLRHKLNPDGVWTLYSVGEDGQDNGGDPTPSSANPSSKQWLQGRDWVWPKPAPKE